MSDSVTQVACLPWEYLAKNEEELHGREDGFGSQGLCSRLPEAPISPSFIFLT